MVKNVAAKSTAKQTNPPSSYASATVTKPPSKKQKQAANPGGKGRAAAKAAAPTAGWLVKEGGRTKAGLAAMLSRGHRRIFSAGRAGASVQFHEHSATWFALTHGRNQPFYHVLPDTRDRPGAQLTYVAQENILADTPSEPLQHPMTDEMFDHFDSGEGRFVPNALLRSQYPLAEE